MHVFTIFQFIIHLFLFSFTFLLTYYVILLQHFMEGHAKTAPISRLPLITMLDAKRRMKDIPVCQVMCLNF